MIHWNFAADQSHLAVVFWTWAADERLDLPALQGHVAVVNSLIAKGENVDAATNVSGHNLSHYLTVSIYEQITLLLLLWRIRIKKAHYGLYSFKQWIYYLKRLHERGTYIIWETFFQYLNNEKRLVMLGGYLRPISQYNKAEAFYQCSLHFCFNHGFFIKAD